MARIIKLTPEQLAQELAKLEQEHGMTSLEFFERYQAGEMGDSETYMHWAWLCGVALRRGLLTPSATRA